MTKSPRAVAREALRLAREALPPYSAPRSRKDFTQHPLFAALALETFPRTDYRGVAPCLADVAAIRGDLGPGKGPPDSTPCSAAGRLLKAGRSCASSRVPPRPPSLAA